MNSRLVQELKEGQIHIDNDFQFTAPRDGIYEITTYNDHVIVKLEEGINTEMWSFPKNNLNATKISPAAIRAQANVSWEEDGGFITLPPGYTVAFEGFFNSDNPHNEQMYKPEVKCECGVTITMGKDYHESGHSNYCPVYVRWLDNGKK